MIKIGITGGIGSGKTTVAKIFRDGFNVSLYNSDDRAKEMYFNTEVKPQIIELLGEKAYLNDSLIDTKYIANIVFNDKKILEKVNSIIHPHLEADFKQAVEDAKNKGSQFIIKESAILLESEDYKELDFIILVTAQLETRIERVINRNKISRYDVLKRINSQWTDEQRIPFAKYIIVNDGNYTLYGQINNIMYNIHQLYKINNIEYKNINNLNNNN